MDGYGVADLCAVLMEFALYGGAIWFLARVSEDVTDYASLKGYLSVGWNVMDVLSVACFLVVMVLRAMWMLRMMSDSVNEYEEHIDTDEHADDAAFGPFSFDVYMRLRLTFQYYRYCRNFLATGVLITFIKAFKFLSVSKQLSQFTETIYVVSSEMLSVVLILAIILVGHAVAFHISLGHAIAGYRTFFDSMMTLAPGRERAATFPTSKAPLSAVYHSLRLMFGRAIIPRSALEAWTPLPERARAARSRRSDVGSPRSRPGSRSRSSATSTSRRSSPSRRRVASR
jgi:hypothetical protein